MHCPLLPPLLVFSTIALSLNAPAESNRHLFHENRAGLIRESLSLHGGTLYGDLQPIAPDSFNVNAGFTGEGWLLLPGSPDLQIHRHATVEAIEYGDEGSPGVLVPDDSAPYSVRVQRGVFLQGIRTGVTPPAFPAVAPLSSPPGADDLRLRSGESYAGDPANIRGLRLELDSGPFYLPPGAYGELHVQRGARLVLGIAGERAAARYSFEKITWHDEAVLDLLGPVRIVAGSMPVPLGGSIGNPDRPEWLSLAIVSGGWILNRDAAYFGALIVPDGKVVLNGESLFCGTLMARSLALNPGATLSYCAPGNDPPVAAGGGIELPRYGSREIDLLGFAADPDGDDLTVELLTLPEHGALTTSEGDFISDAPFSHSAPGQAVIYTPEHGFFGRDSFTYRVFDGELYSDEAEVSLDVFFVNHRPVAELQAVFTQEEMPAGIVLSASDFDEDDLIFSIAEPPAHGTLDGAAPDLIYAPAPGFYGLDSFTFTANDGHDESPPAAVAIEVNARPRVSLAAPGDGAVFLTPAAVELLAQVEDPDGFVTEVSFFTGESLLGEATEAPFSMTWENVPAGVHAIHAVARDDRSATGVSGVIEITIRENTPPFFVSEPLLEIFEEEFYQYAPDVSDLDLAFGDFLKIAAVEKPGWMRLFEREDGGVVLEGVAKFEDVGIHSIRLEATDSKGLSAQQEFTVKVRALNRPPVVEAGPDVALGGPGEVAFQGTGTDDGLPAGSQLVSRWRVLSGDVRHVSFDDAFRLETVASFERAGEYVLRLTVSDGEAMGYDDVRVSVPNQAPLVAAGMDATVVAGRAIGLEGHVSDDGSPADGVLIAHWSVTSGDAAGVLFDSTEDPETRLCAISPGIYRLRLSASDGELAARDEITVTVIPVANQPPVVDAGPDQEVALHAEARLFGAVDDDGLPEGGGLTYQWSQVGGAEVAAIDNPERIQPFVTFGTAGEYSFRLTVSDGEFEVSDETTVTVALDNQAPRVTAGEDLQLAEGAIALLDGMIYDDGLPLGETLMVKWSKIAGPGTAVFQRPASGVTPLEVSEPGEYRLRLSAHDGELESFDEVTVQVGSSRNQPPVVHAGPDQSVDYILARTGNLLANSGGEEPLAGDGIAGWDAVGASWQRIEGGGNGLPSAAQGSYFFRPAASGLAELRQEVDVSLFAEPIDEGGQLFEFSFFYRVAEQIRYDEPRIRVEYQNAAGEILILFDVEPTPLSAEWGFLADTQVAPQGTRRILVRLLASNSGVNSGNDVYFDGVSLRGVRLPPVQLAGTVEDDGLPLDSVLTTEWRTVSGPVSGIFEDPRASQTPAYFPVPGIYEVELLADDGAASARDRVTVTVVDQAGVQSLQVDAGSDLTTSLPLAQVKPEGLVAGETGGSVRVSWAEVGGSARVFIENPHSLTPEIRFYEAGEYTLRLSASEGDRVAFDEMRVIVACPDEIQPLDVVMVIDRSGSMGGERIVNARLASQQFIERMLPADRAAVVPFSYGATLAQGLTFEHAAAIQAVQAIQAGGDTAIHTGIDVAAAELAANGRVDAQWVILLLSDGESDYSSAVSSARAAHAAGIRIIPIGLGSGTAEQLMLACASSRADYFFAETGSDLEPIYDGLSGSFCRFLISLEVFTGPLQQLPSEAATAVLQGRVSYQYVPEDAEVTTVWEKVSGPGEVVFDDPDFPHTKASFGEPGAYVLSLTASIRNSDTIYSERTRTLTVLVDQPSDALAPAGLVALWKGEGNVFDSQANFHGIEPAKVAYGDGAVQQAFVFGAEASRVKAPTEGQLNVGNTEDGFTVEFWAKIDAASGYHRLLGWYDSNGEVQFSLQKVGSSNRYFRVQWRNETGILMSATSPTYTYTVGQWEHFALIYSRSHGVIRIYRNGVFLSSVSSVGPAGIQTDGDFFFGGHANGSEVLDGSLDELSIYDRPLTPEEVSAVAGAKGKVVLGTNRAPVVDAGADTVLRAVDDPVRLLGIVADDDLPLGSLLRTRWSKLTGPGEVTFGNVLESETTAHFSTPGIYTLELMADDGMAIFRDTLRVAVAWADGALQPPPGLRAHWTGEGTTREEIDGMDASPVGAMSYTTGAVGEAFRFQQKGYLLSRTGGTLDVGQSPDGFTLEFWARIDSTLDEQVLAGWYGETGHQFAVTKVSTSWRTFRISWRDGAEQVGSLTTASEIYTEGQWRHFAFAYERSTGRLRVYSNGGYFQTLNLPVGGFPTPGDFAIGGQPPYGYLLNGALDEVSVYDRQLEMPEIWAIRNAGAKGKIVAGENLPPVMEAGRDFALFSVEEPGSLSGSVSDDGLPAGSGLRTHWSKLTGPGEAVFSDPSRLETTVQFDAPGIYTLELSANDGIAISRDTLRVVVDWSDGALLPPPGLRAHWPGEGTGREMINRFDAEEIGAASYAVGVVGEGFQFGQSGYRLAPTGGELNAGESPDGFTVEFWARINSTSYEQVIAGWYGDAGVQFAVSKISTSWRTFRITWRTRAGQVQSATTASGVYNVGQWQHFAFAYDYFSGQLRVYNNGTHFQTLTLPAGGFSTAGDFSLGGRPFDGAVLNGAMDEISIYDRQLDASEVWEIRRAGAKGKAVDVNGLPPMVHAGYDFTLASIGETGDLTGFVSDDGLPPGTNLRIYWKKRTGPGEVTFGDPSEPETTVQFDTPGIYTLELSANDGYTVARDVLRAVIDWDVGAVEPPGGLRAHWPGEGTGREVVNGLDAKPLGAMSYAAGVVGEGFRLGQDGYMLSPSNGRLDVGESPNGFTVEFWMKIDSTLREEVIAGWYVDESLQFAVSKLSASWKYLRVSWRNRDGNVQHLNTGHGAYSVGQWQHFAFTYDPLNGGLRMYRNGAYVQTLNLSAGGLSTTGDFSFGGRPFDGAVLNGALDEVSVYDRQLDAPEVADIHSAGSFGKAIRKGNEPPVAFAGFDQSREDVLLFTLTGYAGDDGLPAGAGLQVGWTQLDGPAPAEILSAGELTSGVRVSEFGRYTFRLTATDGEFATHSDVVVDLTVRAPTNIPPVVDAGGSFDVTLPSAGLLNGFASDPDEGPLPIVTTWSRVSGPAPVYFDEAAALETTVDFTAVGRYLLRLAATDGVDTVFDYLEVTVHAEVTNESPVANAGEDFTIAEWVMTTLHGAATDDGIRGALQITWSQSIGPASVFFESPNQAVTGVQFPQTGVYTLELRAFDGEKEGIDQVTVTVVEPANQPPEIDAGGALAGSIGEPVSFLPTISDDGLPHGYLTTHWTYSSGAGGASLAQVGDGELAATFSKVGEHRYTLSVSDGAYSISDDLVIVVTAPNRAGPSVAITSPVPGDQATAGDSLFLEAVAEDPEGAVEAVEFYANGNPIGAAAAAEGSYRLIWEGIPAGRYQLTAVARNEIRQSASSETVRLDIDAVSPGVTISAPADGSFHLQGNALTLWATGTGGAALASVDFVVDNQVVARADSAPFVAEHLFLTAGIVNLRASAQTVSGEVLESEAVSVTVVASSGEEHRLEIVTPEAADTVTSPVEVRGVVAGGALNAYQLQFRSAGATNPAAWKTIAAGGAPAGTADDPASLGVLDPTLLRNGLYHLRVQATDPLGQTVFSESVSIVIDGGMKVGHFQLAFRDLSAPVAGIPIQLIRSYDSRGGLADDFGPDWDIGFRSAQVYASGPIGRGWEDYVVRVQAVTGIPIHGIRPERRQVVTVVVDGEVQQFETYSPTEQGFYSLSAASVAFRAINGSNGTLALAQGGNFPIERIDGEVLLTDFFDAIDPDDFIYTSMDGTRLEIQRVFGLRKLTDRNENSLTFSENGITHSGGESISFTRDAAGRITVIEDTAGAEITYAYDEHGYLASITNRAGETTWFEYTPHPAAPESGRRLLKTIIDPLGNRAIAAEYDSDGRLLSQADGDGRATSFAHDIPNRRQVVTNRLGHATTHEYDFRGNVVRAVDPLGNETLREYDERDNEIRTIDALGNITTRVYDADNQLLFETSPSGGVTGYTYDAFGSPLSITDPAGNETVFSYDGSGNLLGQTDALGNVTQFEYDSRGTLTAMVDPENNRTEFSYDARGNQTLNRLRDAAGTILRETHSTYDANGNQLTRTIGIPPADAADPDVRPTTQYFYDGENRLIRTIHPPAAIGAEGEGGETQTVFDAAGQEIQRIDALGRVTNMEYDSRGNRTRIVYPDGVAETSTYDAEDNLIAATNAPGHTTTYEYDKLGRQVAIVHPDGTSTDTVYDEIGRVIATVDERGNITQYEYDENCGCANRRTRVIDALGNVTHYTYDESGNQTSITDARGHVTTFEYDALNRPLRTIYPNGTTTEASYDSLGRRSSETDQEGRTTTYEFDPLGRLTAIIQPPPAAGENPPIPRYQYDEQGNRTAQIDALGRASRFEYDSLGRRTRRVLPGGEEESYEYDIAGRVIAKTAFDGYTTTYQHDARDRLVKETADSSHPSLTQANAAWRHVYEYDSAGRRTAAVVLGRGAFGSIELFRETLQYDARGRLVRKEVEQKTPSGTVGYHLDYSYDEAGNLTGILSSNQDGAAALYTYDELNRLATVEDRDGGITDYSYNAVGSLEGYTYPNQVSIALTYNRLNRLTSLQSARDASFPLGRYQYTLRLSGHRARVIELNGRRTDYEYDGLYRLTNETITEDPWHANGGIGYTHDLVGNRLKRTSTLAGTDEQALNYDDNDRLGSYAYDDSGNTIGGVERLDGEVAGFTDSYDFQNRLILRVWDNGTEIQIRYDADGNRVAKTGTRGAEEAETLFIVDTRNPTGWPQVLEELLRTRNHERKTTVIYTYGHDLIGQTRQEGASSWRTRYYGYDGHGNVRYLTDGTGEITDTYDYDAFGNLIRQAVFDPFQGLIVAVGPDNAHRVTDNNYLFTGEQWDPDLSLYVLRARYLNPNLGRFHTADPFEGFTQDPTSLHKYLYAHANPVSYVDPSGYFSLTEVAMTMLLPTRSLATMRNRAIITGFFAAVDIYLAAGIYRPTIFALSYVSSDPKGVLRPVEVHSAEYLGELALQKFFSILRGASVRFYTIHLGIAGNVALGATVNALGGDWRKSVPILGTWVEVHEAIAFYKAVAAWVGAGSMLSDSDEVNLLKVWLNLPSLDSYIYRYYDSIVKSRESK